MRISKTSILVAGLLPILALALVGCGGKQPKESIPSTVPSTSPTSPPVNQTSSDTQIEALLSEINRQLDLQINVLTIARDQGNKQYFQTAANTACMTTLVYRQKLLELGINYNVSSSNLSEVNGKLANLRSLAQCSN